MTTILLIEDNEEIRENLGDILGLANYNVLLAENGKIGIELALKHKPELIICDIMMPVLDGYSVIHMLQKNQETCDIPFIFLTAMAERAEVRKGMELGADDYLTKPFNGTELLNAVESRLRKVNMLKEKISGINGLNKLIDSISGKEALDKFLQNRTHNKYKKKQEIYSEGKYPHSLFYIEKGKVKTYKINDDGKEFIVGLYNEGDFVGYTSLFDGTAYRDTAETIEECEIATIPKAEFDELINSNREVLFKFVKLLANNVFEKETQLLGIAYNSIRKKVADALITLSKKYKNEKDGQFSMRISRENLANMAGTAKESLIRTLSDFKDENLIDIREGDIVITNEKKLINMLN